MMLKLVRQKRMRSLPNFSPQRPRTIFHVKKNALKTTKTEQGLGSAAVSDAWRRRVAAPLFTQRVGLIVAEEWWLS